MNVQIIEKNGKPEWAVLPYQVFEKMQAVLEDAEDIHAIDQHCAAVAAGTAQLVPSDVTFAILEGTHPVRAWREYKKIKLLTLAELAGISAAYLSQIETAKRNPSMQTMRAIAKALDIELEMLL